MNRPSENTNPTRREDPEALEPELRHALDSFRLSVTSWSEAMMSRPRPISAPRRTNWGLVTKWVLGCTVFAGTVSGGLYQNYRQQEILKAQAARVARRAAQQQQELAQATVKEQSAEELMAKVDSDISREVPSALEPLATLMTDEQSNGN